MRVQSRFPPPLPLDEVDIEVGMELGVPVGREVRVARRVGAASRLPALRTVACASACGLSLVGCALWQDEPASKPRAMSIEPLYRVEDAPLPLEAYLATARYFEGSRDWSRAAEAYAKAAARDASSVEALDGMGRMLAASGRLDAAELTLRRAVDLSPGRARPRNNLAYVLLLKDRPQEALALLDEALKIDPGYARARENRNDAVVRIAAMTTTAVAANPPMEPSPGVIVETPPIQTEVPNGPPSPPPSPAPRERGQDSAAGAGRPSPQPSPALRERGQDSALPRPLTDALPLRLQAGELPPRPQAGDLPPRPQAGEGWGEGLPALAPSSVAVAPATPSDDGASKNVVVPPRQLPYPIRLEISNGVGTTGMAARVDRWMVDQGLPKSRLTNQPTYDVLRTRVDYRAGQAEAARRVVASLPPGVPAQLREQPGLRGDIRVVIGRDWLAATPPPRRVAALSGGLDATSDL